jgi:hypothetical protein
MRSTIVIVCMLFGMCIPAAAEVRIGINLQLFPDLVAVPGYPVYYAPQVDSNFFFYDGLYWVYDQDGWYSSNWYNGPWDSVSPEYVPYFILRVPVRYYRRPPMYFRGWGPEAPPRWGDHWGRNWQQRRSGWDHWDRASAPARAPLPIYQRAYSRDRYPHASEQRKLQNQNYRYQPRDTVNRGRVAQHPGKSPQNNKDKKEGRDSEQRDRDH